MFDLQRLALSFLVCSLVLAGCGSSGSDAAVGVQTSVAQDASRSRTLVTEIWYPATVAGGAAGSEVIEFEADEPDRTTLQGLLTAASRACVATSTNAVRGATPDATRHPLIVYSHCHNCTRWSAHSVMERLASAGYIVVAPDHADNTIFESLAGTSAELDLALVEARVADVQFLLDEIAGGRLLPEGVIVDMSRIGMMGHSIGSLTAGAVAERDSRIDAVLGVAAPFENPLLPAATMANINVPVGLVVATQDNSILQIGNNFIVANFMAGNEPIYRLDIVDAGHWSVTNISGLVDGFAAGCGEGLRHDSLEPFTYIDVEDALEPLSSFAAAFFDSQINTDEDALAFLRSNPWPEAAPIEVRDASTSGAGGTPGQ